MYVYIGELGSTWSYPQVFITDVQVGYSNYEYDRWDNGWAIAFDTASYNTVYSTQAVYPPTSSANNNFAAYASIFYDAGNTAYYVDPASTSNLVGLNVNQLNNNTWYAYNDNDRNAGSSTYLPTAATRSVRFFFATAASTSVGGNYAGVFQFNPWDGTTSSTGDAAYQLAFGGTAANGAGLPQINIRKGIDSTWNSWYTLLHSGNYNSYSPTLTGTGASGTWGINISGNAATATTLSGTVAVANGGTGATSFGTRVFLTGNGTSAISGGIFSHDGSTTYTMRPPNGGTSGSVILTMGPTSSAGSAEINLNAIGGGYGNGIINSTAPLELRRSGTTIATVDTNNITMASGKFVTFAAAATPNYNVSVNTDTINGSTTNALFINPSSAAAANVVISAVSVANAALWLKPNSTGSGVGIVGTINDLNVEIRRNQNNYIRLAASNAISTVIQGGTAGTLYPAYFARAWVNFNGTGVVAIRSSGNVTSISDNGTGDYTVNFTTAMPDANYAVAGSCGNADTSVSIFQSAYGSAQTASACRVSTEGGFSNIDRAWVSVAIFR